MRLEHVNIVVEDISAELIFLKSAFPSWYTRGEGNSLWSGKSRKWLHFGDEFSYITINDNGEGNVRNLAGHSNGIAHLGFEVTNIEALIQRMRESGFKPHSGGKHPHLHNAYFVDPAGNEFEFVEYFSDHASERNLYD